MAAEIHVRVYEELNAFLPLDKWKRRFAHRLPRGRTVRAVLRSLRIPESEVDLVLVNGDPAGFDSPLHQGDFVSFYPVFESFDIGSLRVPHGRPLRHLRFIIEPELSDLAALLQELGFDVLRTDRLLPERTLLEAEKDRRILLTKTPALSRLPGLSRICLIRSSGTEEQLEEVASRLHLFGRGGEPR